MVACSRGSLPILTTMSTQHSSTTSPPLRMRSGHSVRANLRMRRPRAGAQADKAAALPLPRLPHQDGGVRPDHPHRALLGPPPRLPAARVPLRQGGECPLRRGGSGVGTGGLPAPRSGGPGPAPGAGGGVRGAMWGAAGRGWPGGGGWKGQGVLLGASSISLFWGGNGPRCRGSTCRPRTVTLRGGGVSTQLAFRAV